MEVLTSEEMAEKANVIDIKRLRASPKARAWLIAGVCSSLFALGPFILMLTSPGRVYLYAMLVLCQLGVSLVFIQVSLFVHRLDNIERICREESEKLRQQFYSAQP